MFKGFVVVDIETTAIKHANAEICEIAAGSYKDDEWHIVSELRGTRNPIPPEASKICHISTRMLEGLPLFGSDIEREFTILGIPWGQYYVAHNAKFDRELLVQELYKAISVNETTKLTKDSYVLDFGEPENWICTVELSKRLLGNEISQFSLNYLRYYLDLDVPDEMYGHRAGNDVLITAKLFEHLVMLMLERELLDITNSYGIGWQIVQYCSTFIPYGTFPFGKYKGQRFEDIPKDYYEWALENMDALKEDSDRYDERLAKTLEPVLTEIFK